MALDDMTPFLWGQGGTKENQTMAARRRLAETLLKQGSDAGPVNHWAQGAARVAQAMLGGYMARKAGAEETAQNEALASVLSGAFNGSSPNVPAATSGSAAAPSFAGGAGSRTMAMPVSEDMKVGIADAAKALGISPVDLATTISYETGGTFNPTQAGPTTKWGQHRGLIQFGEPQAQQYGVDWSNPAASQLGANGAIVAYLRDRGVKPGMGLMDIYSTINAGAPGLYNRSDAAAGGAPGTVADKVNSQMSGHRARARALFPNVAEADLPALDAAVAEAATGQDGFAIPPAPNTPQMSGQTFDQIASAMGSQPLDPVFQTEGVSQPWMGTALPPAEPQMVQAPLPPPRPALADMPAVDAVPAMGQLPPPQTPSIDPNSNDAGIRAQIAADSGGASASPFSGIARALAGEGSAPSSSSATQAQPQSGVYASQPLAQTGASQASAPAARSAANPMAALAVALIRSGQTDAGVKLATSLLTPQQPIVMGDRLVSRDGKVIADFSNANGGRSKSYGLNPVWGTDKDGNPVIGQIGEKGDFVQTKMPENFKLSSGVDKIDAGTHWVLQDKRTGQTVGTIPKDIAGEEKARIQGKSAGEASVGLGDAIAKSEQILDSIKGIRSHPGRAAWGAQGSTAAWPVIGNGLPGTEGRDFVTRVDQLKGQSFLEAFNMLRGGGAISEQEGKAATSALARLDRAQSKEGFDAALNDLEAIIRGGMERARKKAGVSAPAAPAANSGGGQTKSGVKWSVE